MKKIFIYILTILLLFQIPKVSALTSNLIYMPSSYYIIEIKESNYYNSNYQGYLKLDGRIVYCLDPEKYFISDLNYNSTDLNKAGLTNEQLERINLIGHYGYEYGNHQSLRYYMATQELIWYVTRPSIVLTWATQRYGYNSSIFDVNNEKEEILKLVNNHYKKPDFDNKEFIIYDEEELVLTDDILKEYDIISSNESSATIEDNKLIIRKHGNNNEEIKLKKKISYDDKKMALYESEGYQTVIMTRNNDEIISTVKLKSLYGSVKIKKVDSVTNEMIGQNEATLRNTKYNLYSDNMEFIKEIILNEEEKIETLRIGKYKLQEVESGKGYILDNNIYTFEITEDNLNPEIILKNDIISASFIIEKTYGEDKRKEENAVFEIKDNIGNVNEIVTNNLGIASIKLNYGKYIVSQIKGIKSHYLTQPFIIEVNDTNDINVKLNNNEIKANLLIKKIDFETKEIITDKTIFKIYNDDSNEYLKNNDSNEFETEDGILNLSNISLGNYIIEEVLSPSGYLLSSDKIKINLENDMVVEFENKVDYRQIEITKVGENELLDEVVFEVSAKDDISLNNRLIYKKNEVIESLVTKKGKAISKNLIPSIYIIKEIETNDNYVLDNTLYEIDLNKSNKITIENHKKQQSIEKENDMILLEDKKIDVIEEKINKEVNEVKTDQMKELVIDVNNSEEIKIDDNYIRIPNTSSVEYKLDKFGALIIILMGYVIIKYAKE